MRLTDFWSRMESVFGQQYAHSWAADVVLPPLGCTAMQALARGDDTRDVWRAVCAVAQVPAALA